MNPIMNDIGAAGTFKLGDREAKRNERTLGRSWCFL